MKNLWEIAADCGVRFEFADGVEPIEFCGQIPGELERAVAKLQLLAKGRSVPLVFDPINLIGKVLSDFKCLAEGGRAKVFTQANIDSGFNDDRTVFFHRSNLELAAQIGSSQLKIYAAYARHEPYPLNCDQLKLLKLRARYLRMHRDAGPVRAGHF